MCSLVTCSLVWERLKAFGRLSNGFFKHAIRINPKIYEAVVSQVVISAEVVSRAVHVITYSRNCGDPTGIIRWCENGGRKRRKASKTAPVGDAASRHERAKKKASITRGKKLKKR